MGVATPNYSSFPGNKFFFGHFLARTFDFGMTVAPVPIHWDGDPAERAAGGIHNDKNSNELQVSNKSRSFTSRNNNR